MTNHEFFTGIYEPYQKAFMTPRTSYERSNKIKLYLLQYYGEDSPSNVSSHAINAVYDEMKSRGLANNTIYGTRAALMSFFKMASEYGECCSNPVADARLIRQEIERSA